MPAISMPAVLMPAILTAGVLIPEVLMAGVLMAVDQAVDLGIAPGLELVEVSLRLGLSVNVDVNVDVSVGVVPRVARAGRDSTRQQPTVGRGGALATIAAAFSGPLAGRTTWII
jgi:hypothetical protein